MDSFPPKHWLALQSATPERERLAETITRLIDDTDALGAALVWTRVGDRLIHRYMSVGSTEIPEALDDYLSDSRSAVTTVSHHPNPVLGVDAGGDGSRNWSVWLPLPNSEGLGYEHPQRFRSAEDRASGIARTIDRPVPWIRRLIQDRYQGGDEDPVLHGRIEALRIVSDAVEDCFAGTPWIQANAESAIETLAVGGGAADEGFRLSALSGIADQDACGVGSVLIAWADQCDGAGHRGCAIAMLGLALTCAQLSGDAELATDALRLMGRALRRVGELDSAITAYESGLRIAEASQNTVQRELVELGLANTEREMGRWPAAIARLNRLAASTDSEISAGAHHNLLGIVKESGSLLEAARHGWRAIELSPSEETKLYVLQDLGAVLLDLGATDLSSWAFEIVRDRVAHTEYRAMASFNLGRAHAVSGDGESAEREWNRALEIQSSVAIRSSGLVEVAQGRAILGDREGATRALDEAEEIATRARLAKSLVDIDRVREELENVQLAGPAPAPFEDLAEIRGGLLAMREQRQ